MKSALLTLGFTLALTGAAAAQEGETLMEPATPVKPIIPLDMRYNVTQPDSITLQAGARAGWADKPGGELVISCGAPPAPADSARGE